MATISVLDLFICSLIFMYGFPSCCESQQEYENNKQLDCGLTNGSTILGYACNVGSSACSSYLTFRSEAPFYQSPVQISFLLNATTSAVSAANSATDVVPIPAGDLVLVPVPCSCSAGGFYQHNATYQLKFATETYFTVANDTYQGLSTCQALIAQNPYESTKLLIGMALNIPVRCACPTASQVAAGVKYLLSYLVTWGDDPSSIAAQFKIDEQSLLQANGLNSGSTIYPFTTLLVPLKTEPTKDEVVAGSPPPQSQSPPPLAPPSGSGSSHSNKWIFVGIGIGAGSLALVGFLLCGIFFCCRYRRVKEQPHKPVSTDSMIEYSELSEKSIPPATSAAPLISSQIRTIIESLTLYNFDELDRATSSFADNRRIEGSSVYHGLINGDEAAIKRLKGDVSNEINILKHINHSNIVRLSGFCLHQGDTYLVHEFAGNGSLADWLHHRRRRGGDSNSGEFPCLTWKQRVQVAYDVADGLNYLHNYTNPPYVHKNLKSSNVLLDGEFRAKLSNFGLARAVKEEVYVTGESGPQPQITRHVVGTQGYMAPEYLEHGLITTQLDVFSFGVILLELLSGNEAVRYSEEMKERGEMLWERIGEVLTGEDARVKLRGFVDTCLQGEYPLDLAYAMAELALRCVAREPGSRPAMSEVLVSLSAVYNSTFDWDPSDYGNSGSSMIDAR